MGAPPIGVPLVAAIWEGEDFGGPKRTIIRDVADLDQTAFNDDTSATGIHPGPSFYFDPFASLSFFEESNFRGRELVLPPGQYPSMDRMGFDNTISSIRFNRDLQPRQRGIHNPDGSVTIPVELDSNRIIPQAAPIPGNGMVLHVLAGEEGDAISMDLLETADSLRDIYGSEWNDRLFFVEAFPIYGFPKNLIGYARLHRDETFLGGHIELAPAFDAENVPMQSWGYRLPDYHMSGSVSSVEFLPPPIPIREPHDRALG